MGPYSEETQTQRAASIEKLLLNKDNSKEVRRMETRLTCPTEEEYNLP